MFTNFKLLLSVVLLLSCVVPVFSFEPSGGVLLLDGEDDYAILPFAEHGYIIPEGAREFTVEAWVYPKAEPKEKDNDLILSQQVVFRMIARDRCRPKKNQFCSTRYAYLSREGAHGIAGIDDAIEKDQWNYIAIIFKNSTLYHVTNDQITGGRQLVFANRVSSNIRRPEGVEAFVVGGFDEDKEMFDRHGQLLFQVSWFQGAIDAIRFSNIARYDLPNEPGIHPFIPPHRLFSDQHTLAFWDFNDKEGETVFQDESGNGNTLIGMNGAMTIGGAGVNLIRDTDDGLDVRPNNSLTTTWGQIKLE